jgi:FkbM family methyltransferase
MNAPADLAIDSPGGWGRLRACRHGLFLFNRNDVYIGRSLDLYGEFSELEARLLCSLLRPGDVFVEAGANIGSLTVPMARRVGPTGQGVAFEPQRLNHMMLCANLGLNGICHVQTRQAGLAAADGVTTVMIYDPAAVNNYGDIRLGAECENVEQVAVTTVDGLGLSRCRLIKIDVQGMEPRVLEGAKATIAACRPALWVENDDRAASPALIRRIRALGYRLWWHLAPMFNPDNFRQHGENIFPRVVSCNLMCLPAEGALDVGAPEILDDDDWPLADD